MKPILFLLVPFCIHFQVQAKVSCKVFVPTFLRPFQFKGGSTVNETLTNWGQQPARSILLRKAINGREVGPQVKMVDVVIEMLGENTPFARMMNEVVPEFVNRETGEIQLPAPVVFAERYQGYLERIGVPKDEQLKLGAIVKAKVSTYRSEPLKGWERVFGGSRLDELNRMYVHEKSTADYEAFYYGQVEGLSSRFNGTHPDYVATASPFNRHINFFDLPFQQGILPVHWSLHTKTNHTPSVFHELFYAAAWTSPTFRKGAIDILAVPKELVESHSMTGRNLLDHFEYFSAWKDGFADRVVQVWRDADLPFKDGVPVLFTKAEIIQLVELKRNAEIQLVERVPGSTTLFRQKTDYGNTEHKILRDKFLTIVGQKRAEALLKIEQLVAGDATNYGAFIADGASYRNMQGVASSNYSTGHGRLLYQISNLQGFRGQLDPAVVDRGTFDFIAFMQPERGFQFGFEQVMGSILNNPIEIGN